MADPLDELASIIAEKALQRMRGQPAVERIVPVRATPAEVPKECNPDGCGPCE